MSSVRLEFIPTRSTNAENGFGKLTWTLDLGEGKTLDMSSTFTISLSKRGNMYVQWPSYKKNTDPVTFGEYVSFPGNREVSKEFNLRIIEQFKEWLESRGIERSENDPVQDSTPEDVKDQPTISNPATTRRRSVSWKTSPPVKIG